MGSAPLCVVASLRDVGGAHGRGQRTGRRGPWPRRWCGPRCAPSASARSRPRAPPSPWSVPAAGGSGGTRGPAAAASSPVQEMHRGPSAEPFRQAFPRLSPCPAAGLASSPGLPVGGRGQAAAPVGVVSGAARPTCQCAAAEAPLIRAVPEVSGGETLRVEERARISAVNPCRLPAVPCGWNFLGRKALGGD